MQSSDSQSLDNSINEMPNKTGVTIVGLGASAGGIQALKEFFGQVPVDSDMAYVVILHLSPSHDSQLSEVLQQVTKMPVLKVIQREKVEPNHVYVVPPNQHLMMEDGHIQVSVNIFIEDRRAPVDIFFRTLAESHGARAVCVVLSGTGANGSMGLKRIKEKGGAVFVQNPREAEFNEMPRNAIATDLVDEVLPVAEIPLKIIAYRNSLGTVRIKEEAAQRPEDQQQALREIFTQLRLRTGNDFSNYKLPTLLRRIERRINVRNLPNLSAYVDYLKEHPDEATALLKDLLISVTNFFRDKKAWEVMDQEILPQLIKAKTEEQVLRIWVAGCATGEEAYTVAMLCAEKLMGVLEAPKVQIFATDIDETAIAQAREGYYTLNDAADVPEDKLRRFFNKEGDGYRIRREIREMVMFAHHNFIKDPPFSHLDLITCRNVLIYLNRLAQERVIETFHFALEPGAFLFLGSSETVDSATDLYATFNREQHIFQSRRVQTRSFPVPEAVPVVRTEILKPPLPDPVAKRGGERISYGDLHQRLLEQYAAPSIVVSQDYDIVHISESASRFLQINSGEFSQNIVKLVRPELRLELRSALFQALDQQTAIRVKPLQVSIDNQIETISLHIRPVLRPGNPDMGFILILFESASDDNYQQKVVLSSDEPVTRHLEEELMQMKTQLRSTIEQYEFQGEELKASNEELQAMNEELRSAAEELETSKEELQSINEELRTVNQELKVKVEETVLSSNNLQNLINSTNIGTIFLDRGLRVRMFTPAIGSIFNLIQADIGRPLSDITNKIVYAGLTRDAEMVLEKLQTVEREVRTLDAEVFLMRILPYRTAEDRINGVVLTFINITERKEAEEQSLTSHQRTIEILESINDAFYAVDAAFNFTYINKKAEILWGRKRETLIGKSFGTELADAVGPNSFALYTQVLASKQAVHYETVSPLLGYWIEVSIYPNNIDGLSVYFRDISQRKLAEDDLRKSEERMRVFITTSSDVIYRMNANWTEMISLKGADFLPDTTSPNQVWLQKYVPEEEWNHVKAAIQQAIDTKSIFELEHWVVRKDGTYGWTYSQAVPLLDKQGEITEWFGIAKDITASKKSELAMRLSEERLRATMASATDFSIITTNKDGIIEGWSAGAERIFGFAVSEAVGQPGAIVFTPEDRAAGAPEQEMKTAREKGRAADERWHVRKDGSRFFASGVMSPINSDKLTGYVKVARDMTEHRKAEEALRLSEERYRTVIESAEMATWDWDIPANRVAWNKKHYTILGADPQHQPMDPEYFLHFIHPDDSERVRNTLFEAVASNGTYQSEFRIIRDDNKEVRWMDGFGRIVKVEDGQAVRMVGVMTDITERKSMEQQKDDFIGIASHELKTPVTSIKAYAQILQDTFEKSADSRSVQLMKRLDTQVDRLTGLIANLLDTTKIAEGELPLHQEIFNMQELITERIEDLQRLSQHHQLVVQHCENVVLTADRERIGQVLTNLVSNAIKYSPQGQEIFITCQLKDDSLFVSVQDRGIGIAADMMQKVFGRFFRVRDPQLQTFPGMGLGLYITAGIVKRHGGTIGVESKLGEGSTFTFTLPLSKNP